MMSGGRINLHVFSPWLAFAEQLILLACQPYFYVSLNINDRVEIICRE